MIPLRRRAGRPDTPPLLPKHSAPDISDDDGEAKGSWGSRRSRAVPFLDHSGDRNGDIGTAKWAKRAIMLDSQNPAIADKARLFFSDRDYALWMWEHHKETWAPIALTVLAFITRMWRLGRWKKVVWDEAHFGKFADNYLAGGYFFDLHPPFGKILVAFGGWLVGYTPRSFTWDSEKEYPSDLPITMWRAYCAMFGVGTVPLAYWTARNMGLSVEGATLAGVMVLCELAFIFISHFILLDPFLVFFTALTIGCWTRFRSLRHIPFDPEWHLYLFLTGISMGFVSSVKWIGLLTVATVGVHTIADLWWLLADARVTAGDYLRHWVARIGHLIVVPFLVYLWTFTLHFGMLRSAGYQISEMPSQFSLRYNPTKYDGMPDPISFNSRIMLRSAAGSEAVWLESKDTISYPAGSKQQVVFGSRYVDKENKNAMWVVERPWDVVEGEKATMGLISTQAWREMDETRDKENGPAELRNGDAIRLSHLPTGRNFHSHPIPANVTARDFEVTTFYTRDYGDPNDIFIVETIRGVPFIALPGPSRVHLLSTWFRLRHNDSGCYITAQNRLLPQEWADGAKLEVTCSKVVSSKDLKSVFYVDWHEHPHLPATPSGYYKSSFLADVFSTNLAMSNANGQLTDTPDKPPAPFQSHPWEWPLLIHGLRVVNWDDENVKYFMFGNPINWWGGALGLLAFLACSVIGSAMWIRLGLVGLPFGDDEDERSLTYGWWFGGGSVAFLGWVWHYVPFWFVPRVLYLHHYHPALYFAILSLAHFLDQTSRILPRRYARLPFIVVGTLVVLSFFYFKDVSYGMAGPSEDYRGRQWLSSWDLWQPRKARDAVLSTADGALADGDQTPEAPPPGL